MDLFKKLHCWNVSDDEGEQYIIDVFSDIINNKSDIRCDTLASQMSNEAKKRDIKLYYNDRYRNLNYYMKNKYGNLTTFLDNHKDIFEVYHIKNVAFVKNKENWLGDEEWEVI